MDASCNILPVSGCIQCVRNLRTFTLFIKLMSYIKISRRNMPALFKAFLEFYGESEIAFFLPIQRCKISLICIGEKRLLITW